MKKIQSYLCESSTVNVDNIIISGCGSMYEAGINVGSKLLNTFKTAKLWVYDADNDKVVPLDNIGKYNANGPHDNLLGGVADFYKKHLGELTIFVQN